MFSRSDSDPSASQPDPGPVLARWMNWRSSSVSKQLGIDEPVLDDFHCTSKEGFLLQGRLYVLQRHVVFYCSIFGIVRKTVIRIADIVSIRKRTLLRIPNSIEIMEASGQRHVFSSFLASETAYQLIYTVWSSLRPDLASRSREAPRESPSKLERVDEAECLLEEGVEQLARRKSSLLSQARASENPGFRDDGDFMQAEEETDMDVWTMVQPGAMPPRCRDSRLLVSTTINASANEMFKLMLANESHFLQDVLEEQGNRRINISSWKRSEQLGHIRDVQFTAPIKGAFSNWGVSHTNCFVSQRFCRYLGDCLLYEASQTNTDIPYGDCFTVDTRWEMRPDTSRPATDPVLQVDVWLRVPFSRMCFFKKIIESGSFAQSKDMVVVTLDRIKVVLEAERKLPRHNQILLQTQLDGSFNNRLGSVPQPSLIQPPMSPFIKSGAMASRLSWKQQETPGDGATPRTSRRTPLMSRSQSVKQALGSSSAAPPAAAKPAAVPLWQLLGLLLVAALCALQLHVLWTVQAGGQLHAGAARGGGSGVGLQGPGLDPDRSEWFKRLQLLHQELLQLELRSKMVNEEVMLALGALRPR